VCGFDPSWFCCEVVVVDLSGLVKFANPKHRANRSAALVFFLDECVALEWNNYRLSWVN